MIALQKDSRVWIYQSSRRFTKAEVEIIRHKLREFTLDWTSHNNKLKAQGDVYYERFVVLMVDEKEAGASGCSIDKSVYFIQELEREFGVDMFDRMNFAFEKNGEIQTAHKEEFQALYQDGLINDDTIIFNNLVSSKGEFEEGWKIRLGDSWHKNFVN